MREIVLRHFLEGHASAAELDADVAGTLVNSGPADGPPEYHFRVQRMAEEFELGPQHLVRLIDASAAGGLRLEHLSVICDWLDGGAETLRWNGDTPEGERVADVVFWLGNPEINYPLRPEVLSKMRHYLATGENTLTVADTNG